MSFSLLDVSFTVFLVDIFINETMEAVGAVAQKSNFLKKKILEEVRLMFVFLIHLFLGKFKDEQ